MKHLNQSIYIIFNTVLHRQSVVIRPETTVTMIIPNSHMCRVSFLDPEVPSFGRRA